MRVLRVPEGPPPATPPEVVATIGNFDGVHRGHRALIGRVVERAAEMGVESAVITFDPHPLLVIRPQATLRLLSTVEEKGELFGALALDNFVVCRFDASLQQTGAEAFLIGLQPWVRLRRLLHGPGFALGRGREGTPDVLHRIGERLGFELEEIMPLTGEATTRFGEPPTGAPRAAGYAESAGAGTSGAEAVRSREPLAGVVSSTAIRASIAAGEVQRAARSLGRPPTLTGTVVPGERIGRTLGYPTANLAVDPALAVPADGVYAAWAECAPFTPAARRYPAAVSIGTRPTFDGSARLVEAYLLDFDGDLYGQRLRLHFVARLRGQERFDSLPALVAQMGRDVETARAVLGEEAGAADVESLDLVADG